MYAMNRVTWFHPCDQEAMLCLPMDCGIQCTIRQPKYNKVHVWAILFPETNKGGMRLQTFSSCCVWHEHDLASTLPSAMWTWRSIAANKSSVSAARLGGMTSVSGRRQGGVTGPDLGFWAAVASRAAFACAVDTMACSSGCSWDTGDHSSGVSSCVFLLDREPRARCASHHSLRFLPLFFLAFCFGNLSRKYLSLNCFQHVW